MLDTEPIYGYKSPRGTTMLEPVRITDWNRPGQESSTSASATGQGYERVLLVALGCAALMLSLGAVVLAATL